MQETIGVYSDWLAQIDTTTEEGQQQYEEMTQVIEQLNKQQADSLQELDDAYALYLLNLLDNLENSKEESTKKGKEMREGIAKELSELGVDVDIYKRKENILNQIDGLKSDIESRRPTITVDFQGDTTNLQNVYNKIRDGINGAVDYIKENGLIKAGISAGVSLIKKLPSIKFNAEGDLPKVGQLMVVNEKGAELVGQIGGQSFVANQKEIVDFMDKKIGNVQNQQNKQVYNIYLDADHLVASYTLDQLQSMAKSNGSAITIG